MRFVRARYQPDNDEYGPRTVILVYDNWDDYQFKTTFDVYIVDDKRVLHEIGEVKIMTKGMSHGRVSVPSPFEKLEPEFCSLGQDQNYYEKLFLFPQSLREEFLVGIRDCVFDIGIWEEFRDERAMQTSLLRSVKASIIETTFRQVLFGHIPQTPFNFTFFVPPQDSDDNGSGFELRVDVKPGSLPPTNVHAVIGRNGVGKTRLFAGLMNTLFGVTDDTGYPLGGLVLFEDQCEETEEAFANLVTVTFSAFDNFEPVDLKSIKGDIRYNYIGLKKFHDGEQGEESALGGSYSVKTTGDLVFDFDASLKKCLNEPRRTRWLEAISMLYSDPGLRDLAVEEALDLLEDVVVRDVLAREFERLSSGHKIVLLTITKLVELVDERTLVLIDEPESHLHPPLLGSFIRSVSELLTKRNGVGIFATHSPVVLQEIPSSCVTVLRKSGDQIVADRPVSETFAENVSSLTRYVFGLEVSESGYHKLLTKESQNANYHEILNKFNGQIGAEGRAIVRALTSIDRGE
ncbi:MAG TPA: hypothetical protein DCS30_06380 [Rhizobiales bacterium]|nr:hypothetical protein [Hyphomicrobiales bacterium]